MRPCWTLEVRPQADTGTPELQTGDTGVTPLLWGGGCCPGLALCCPGLDPIPPIAGERGCAFCGGLGHRITDCPKLEAMQTKQVSNIGRKDYLAHSSMDF